MISFIYIKPIKHAVRCVVRNKLRIWVKDLRQNKIKKNSLVGNGTFIDFCYKHQFILPDGTVFEFESI